MPQSEDAMRCATQICLALSGILIAAPAVGADWGTPLRGAYGEEWYAEAHPKAIGFEIGMRYWYSQGALETRIDGNLTSGYDTAHIGEAHFRINDYTTDYYLKGMIGYSGSKTTEYTSPVGTETTEIGSVLYAGADLGFGMIAPGFGGFVGYQYWNESPRLGGTDIGGLDFNLLRLGISGRTEITDMVDLTAEAALIPYAGLRGTYGAYDSDTLEYLGLSDVEGWLYGAAGEVMLGVHATDWMTMRFGGRAWYLTGPTTVTFEGEGRESDHFSALRYGLLAELTYRF
ncbi:hypothetical protein EMQ25_08655 [Arsenicitalea aurantiaca]|uniref:Uncharacterized protein n=1 Tax=Arsenicitalea aurantiaca TaxID=1783274 RepID=A0A433XA75_9HYPH|nr:hypothetical protein [Arsenicitalea aurantiaca]RUT30940.1 hypothetical protein EMQ25_08655 [Arsenicitalea aurantiaca]